MVFAAPRVHPALEFGVLDDGVIAVERAKAGPFVLRIPRLYASAMNGGPFRNSRRSTRVPVKVAIEVLRGTERMRCEGETILVNLHGALILTSQGLSAGSNISIHVQLSDKRANAEINPALNF